MAHRDIGFAVLDLLIGLESWITELSTELHGGLRVLMGSRLDCLLKLVC